MKAEALKEAAERFNEGEGWSETTFAAAWEARL